MPTKIPKGFDDFVGNDKVVTRLKLLVSYAKKTGNFKHIGFFGPPGNGKTTLSNIVAEELGRQFVYINSVAVKSPMTLRAEILNPDNLMKGAIICLDEAHRLPKSIQDNMLSVLEYPSILVTTYKDQIIRDTLPDHVSFVLATTHRGFLSNALLSRLQRIDLAEYNIKEKESIAIKYLNRVHNIKSSQLDAEAVIEIGRRARSGRHVVDICDNIRMMMSVKSLNKIDGKLVKEVFGVLDIDENSLTSRDKEILSYLASKGSCGLDTLSDFLDVPKKDIKEKIEPWLLKRGFILRGAGGRTLTHRGAKAIRGERLENV